MSHTLALTAEELHCLSALAGLSQVTGLGPMPFGERSDLEPLLFGTAMRSLHARGILDDPEPSDALTVEPMVERALGVVARPEHAAALQRGGIEGIGVRSFWLGGGDAVELRRVAEHDYELVVFEPAELVERVLAASRLAGAVNGRVPEAGAAVARNTLLAALAGSPAPGLPPLEGASLWEASWISAPAGDDDQAEGGSLSWLDGGPEGAWRVAAADDDPDGPEGAVQLEPVARAALVEDLRAALARLA